MALCGLLKECSWLPNMEIGTKVHSSNPGHTVAQWLLEHSQPSNGAAREVPSQRLTGVEVEVMPFLLHFPTSE